MAVTKADPRIKVEKPDAKRLDALGVARWPIWTKEASTFDWRYDAEETCYLLEGQATVKTDRGEVSFGKGDLVVFPKGLSCTWQILQPVRKHYSFA